MYTEEEYKRLFKRFFGNGSTIRQSFLSESTYYMMNNNGPFRYTNTEQRVTVTTHMNPYTNMLNCIFGENIYVYFNDGIHGNKSIYFHVPSSFEEMSIICDLNGK